MTERVTAKLEDAVPGPQDPGLKICDYTVARRSMLSQTREYPYHPCIMVSWDNTARRRENRIVFINASPKTFGAGLSEMIYLVLHEPFEERLVFVNAWNEWAEGNHLEPDLQYGLGWHEAVRQAALGRIGD